MAEYLIILDIFMCPKLWIPLMGLENIKKNDKVTNLKSELGSILYKPF